MKNQFTLLMLTGVLALSLSCGKSGTQEEKRIEINKPVVSSNDGGSCGLKLEKLEACVNLQWVKQPTQEEEGELTLEFSKLSSSAQSWNPETEGYDLNVILWMPSMGHGSSMVKIIPAEKTATKAVFRVTEVFFIMPGEWDIRIQLRKDNNVVDQVYYKTVQ